MAVLLNAFVYYTSITNLFYELNIKFASFNHVLY
jgi:hypothetical protein